MNVQASVDVSTHKFIKDGLAYAKSAQTVVQDAGRTVDLEENTLMSYDPATGKWHPFIDETATDGTQYPRGVILQTIPTADLVAGDVTGVSILVGGACRVDEDMLVIEASKTLATVINVPAGFNTTVEDYLRLVGIYPILTVDIDGFENA